MENPKTLRGDSTVAWVDTDASGRIHFTAAFRWVEAVEHNAYRTAGLGEHIQSLPRINVAASYKRPLTAGAQIGIELRPTRIGNTSIGYEWTIRHNGVPCIEGNYTVVHVGSEGTPEALPGQLRALLTEQVAG
ncbi:acyl-CoA thioesterase [Paeniglutamicibacter sp.]|uniref:acyl-CoA thioesterase n=1 Tax=Paeniglutamicibacter sp. TaxID=1934391 RepID=UPI003989CB7D